MNKRSTNHARFEGKRLNMVNTLKYNLAFWKTDVLLEMNVVFQHLPHDCAGKTIEEHHPAFSRR